MSLFYTFKKVTYLGCYDDVSELSISVDFDDTKSHVFCGRQCEVQGKSHFAVKNENECNCGDWPDDPSPMRLPEGSCSDVDKNIVYRTDTQSELRRDYLLICKFHYNLSV